MSQIQLLRVFLNQRLTAAAEEIFGAVEQTIAVYQEECCRTKKENDRLQKLLDLVIKPEIKLHRGDLQEVPISEEEVPPEQHHCENKWNPSVGQENPELTQIKTEQEAFRTSHEEEQLHLVKEDFTVSPALMKNDYEHDQSWHSPLPSTSAKQINTGLDEGDYRISEATSNPISEWNLISDCSDAKSTSSVVSHLKMHMQDTNNSGLLEKSFDSTESMQDQLQTHIDTKFTCTSCSKGFTTSTKLRMHMRSHNRTIIPCPFCGKYSNSSANLKVHIRTHTGEKPYRCCDCGKSFCSNSNLKTHLRSHTGEKPYHCPDCGKGFTQSAHVGIHMRIHTGERPYSCSLCDKSFSNGPQLKVHMRIHTGEKPYNCSHCVKSFSSSSGLKVHTMTHTGERPHICPSCKKGFTSVSNLKAHKKQHVL